MNINIGEGDKTNFRTEKFLKNYYRKNKNELMQCKMYNIDNSVVTLLSNNRGWCTVITPDELILQMWAGELCPY